MEVIIAITVIGIALVLAIPSWDSATNKRRVTAAAEQVAAHLAIAQGESIKRNQSVLVAFQRNSGTDWCLGTAVGNAACDCTETDPSNASFCDIDGASSRLSEQDFPLVRLVAAADQAPGAGDGQIEFDPVRGILDPAGDRLSLRLQSANSEFMLDVRMAATGLLRICNPDTTLAVPGFEACL